MGTRELQLEKALDILNAKCGRVVRASSIYETSAWGKTDQPDYLNQALLLETAQNARQLLRNILKAEKEMGRVRKNKYDPRVIDIDILFFNNEVINYSFLTVPHPEIQNRRFALLPLAEIAPDILHPIFGTSVSMLLSKCTDPLEVRKFS